MPSLSPFLSTSASAIVATKLDSTRCSMLCGITDPPCKPRLALRPDCRLLAQGQAQPHPSRLSAPTAVPCPPDHHETSYQSARGSSCFDAWPPTGAHRIQNMGCPSSPTSTAPEPASSPRGALRTVPGATTGTGQASQLQEPVQSLGPGRHTQAEHQGLGRLGNTLGQHQPQHQQLWVWGVTSDEEEGGGGRGGASPRSPPWARRPAPCPHPHQVSSCAPFLAVVDEPHTTSALQPEAHTGGKSVAVFACCLKEGDLLLQLAVWLLWLPLVTCTAFYSTVWSLSACSAALLTAKSICCHCCTLAMQSPASLPHICFPELMQPGSALTLMCRASTSAPKRHGGMQGT